MNTIEFPGLGINLNIDPVLFSFGEIKIYWYGFIIATAFVLAIFLALRDCKKFGVDQEDLIDVILFAAPVAIICSRIYYVIFSWSDFKNNLSEIYKIWHGGLAIYGAIIGAFLTAIIFSRVRKLDVWKLFDIVAPYIIMAQGIGRWGNFINQEAFGANTLLPWGMTGDKISRQLSIFQLEGAIVDPSLPVHPTFLYESLWNFVSFAVLLWFRNRKKMDGEVFFLYMVLYGAGRFWIEGLRLDSLWLGPFRVSQLLAVVFVIVFSSLIFVSRRKLSVQSTEDLEVGLSEYGGILKAMKEQEQTEKALKSDVESDDTISDESIEESTFEDFAEEVSEDTFEDNLKDTLEDDSGDGCEENLGNTLVDVNEENPGDSSEEISEEILSEESLPDYTSGISEPKKDS